VSEPVVGVLAVQGDVREHVAALEACGATARPVRRPVELERVDAVVIPGGESTTMDKLVRAFDLYEPLRERIKRGTAMFGSCAGMIMLADRIVDGTTDQRTLGGLDVTVRRNAFGRQVESFETDLDVGVFGDGPALHAVFIRAPWVEDAGPGVDVLATVAAGPAAGKIVAVRQGALLATAFHPELTGDLRVHRLFLDIVKET
jgi:pyridoxal 5'-phosphate synthase pdxT subunit